MVFSLPQATRPVERSTEILVVGAGPSGLALAAELADRGREVSVIAPDLGDRWAQSYGDFESELAGLGLESAVVRRFAAPEVQTDEARIVLGDPYARLDTSFLQATLLGRCEQAGVSLHRGRVLSVQPLSSQQGAVSRAVLEPGPGDFGDEVSESDVVASLIVDASGRSAAFEGQFPRTPAGYQSAYGMWIDVQTHPFGRGEMSLMDYRTVSDDEPATFLYAIPETGHPHGPGTVFVQETCLFSRQPVAMNVLRERLENRLHRDQLKFTRVLGTERCVIPMGGDLPDREEWIVPFGAVAGLVHPATGYQLARGLSEAPRVADAVESAWSKGSAAATQAAIATMWSDERRRAWSVYQIGAQALGELPASKLRRFIAEFFSLSDGRWQRFMAGRMPAAEIAETMWRIFREAPMGLRTGLMRGGASATARALMPFFV